jgi:hypothetical protein
MAESGNLASTQAGGSGPISGGSLPGSGTSQQSFVPGPTRSVTQKRSKTEPTDVVGLFGSKSNAILNENEPGPAGALAHFKFNEKFDPSTATTPATVKLMFDRPFFHSTTDWNVGQTNGEILTSVEFPSLLIQQKISATGVLRYHKNYRSGFSVHVVVNPTPFQQGALWIVWIPGTVPTKNMSFGNLNVLPHAIINLGEANSGTVHVPWHYWRRYLDTTVPDSMMGTIYVVVLTPLAAGTTDAQTLPVAVWFQLTNPQMDSMMYEHEIFAIPKIPTRQQMERLPPEQNPDYMGPIPRRHRVWSSRGTNVFDHQVEDYDPELEDTIAISSGSEDEMDGAHVPSRVYRAPRSRPIRRVDEPTPEEVAVAISEMNLAVEIPEMERRERDLNLSALNVQRAALQDGERPGIGLEVLSEQVHIDMMRRIAKMKGVFSLRGAGTGSVRPIHWKQKIALERLKELRPHEVDFWDDVRPIFDTAVFDVASEFWIHHDENGFFPAYGTLVLGPRGRYKPTHRVAFVRHNEANGYLALFMFHTRDIVYVHDVVLWCLKYVVIENASTVPLNIFVIQGTNGANCECWKVDAFMANTDVQAGAIRDANGVVLREIPEPVLIFSTVPKIGVTCDLDEEDLGFREMTWEDPNMIMLNGARQEVFTGEDRGIIFQDAMNEYLAENGTPLEAPTQRDSDRAAGLYEVSDGDFGCAGDWFVEYQESDYEGDLYSSEGERWDDDDFEPPEPTRQHMLGSRQVTDMAPASVTEQPSLGFAGDRVPIEGGSVGCESTDTWDYHLSCESLLAQIDWKVTDAPGTILALFPISPMLPPSLTEANAWTNDSPTTQSAISSMYAWWRGTIDIMLQPIITRMHRGRLYVAFIPGDAELPPAGTIVDLSLYASAYTWSFDIGDTSMYVCSVPYVSTTEWTPVNAWNGTVMIAVQTGLSARSETPQTITVNLWLRTGDDFDLATPTARFFLREAGGTPSYPQMEKIESGTEEHIPETEAFAVTRKLPATRQTNHPVGPLSLSTRWNLFSSFQLQDDLTSLIPVHPIQWQRSEWVGFPSVMGAAATLFNFAAGGVNVRFVTNAAMTDNIMVKTTFGIGDFEGSYKNDSSVGTLVTNMANQPTWNVHIPFYNLTNAITGYPDVDWAKIAPFVRLDFRALDGVTNVFVEIYIQFCSDYKYYFPLPPNARGISPIDSASPTRYQFPLIRELAYNGLMAYAGPEPTVMAQFRGIEPKEKKVRKPTVQHMMSDSDDEDGHYVKPVPPIYATNICKCSRPDFPCALVNGMCRSDVCRPVGVETFTTDCSDVTKPEVMVFVPEGRTIKRSELKDMYIPTRDDIEKMDDTMRAEVISTMADIMNSSSADEADGALAHLETLGKTIKGVADAADGVKRTAKDASDAMKKVSGTLVEMMGTVRDYFGKDTGSVGLGMILLKCLIYGAQAYRATGADQALVATQFIIDCMVYVPKIRSYMTKILDGFCGKQTPKLKKVNVPAPTVQMGFCDFLPTMAVDIVEASIGTIPDKKGFLETCKDFSMIANAGKNLQWFFEQIYKLIKNLIDWIRGIKGPGQFWRDHASDMADFVVAADKLNQKLPLEIQRKLPLREELQNLYEVASSILAASVYHPGAPPNLLHTARIMMTLHRDVAKMSDGGRRIEPICVYLSGEPGVGKSVLMSEIAKSFSAHVGIEYKRAVWTANAASKHFDGYAQQPVVCLDDVGQTTDGDDWKNLMQMVGSAQYIPPMAELKDKGTVFTSEIIIASSNQTKPNPTAVLTEIKALHRRLKFPLRVKVKDQFAYKKNKQLKYKDACEHGLQTDDIWDFEFYDIATNAVRKTMQLSEVIDMILQEHDKRYALPTTPQAGDHHSDDCKNCLVKIAEREPTEKDLQILWDTDELATKTPFWHKIYEKMKAVGRWAISETVLRTLSFISMMIGTLSVIWIIYKLWKQEVADDVKAVKKDAAKVQSATAQGKPVSEEVSSELQGDVDRLQHDLTQGPIKMTLEVGQPTVEHTLYQEQQKQRKKAKVVTNAHAELDTTFVRKNMVRIVARTGSGSFRVYGVGLVNDWLMMPVHIAQLEDTESWDIIYMETPERKVTLGPEDMKIHIQPCAPGANHSDVCLLKIPDAPRMFRNIVHRILKGEIHHGRIPGVLMTPKQPDGEIRSCSNVRMKIYQMYHSASKNPDRVVSLKGFGYDAKTREGMCGAPLLSMLPQHSAMPIIGIHTSGNLESTYGESQILDVDWMRQVMRSVKIVPTTAQMGNEAVIPLTHGLKPLYVNTKTSYRKGVLYGLFEDRRQPAVLAGDDARLEVEWDWDHVFTSKFRCNESPEPENFSRAVEHLTEELKTIFGVTEYQHYGWKKAICGTTANLNPVNMQTSAGYPWCVEGVRKSDLLMYSGLDDWDTATYWVSPGLEEQMDSILGGSDVVWTSAMKDELRPIYKIKSGKTRTIDTPPLGFTLLFRQHFGCFCDLYTQHFGVDAHHAIGCDIDRDMTQFWQDLAEVSVVGFDCDFSCFDGSIPAWALKGALRVFAGCTAESEPTEVQKLLFAHVMFSKHHYLNKFVQTTGGVPSGTPATSILNSVIHSLLAMTAWLDLNPEEQPLSQMREVVKFLVYGDDGVFASGVPWYNPIALQAWYADIGMTFTPAEKGEECGDFVPIYNLSFLKRKPRVVAGLVHPCIDMDTVHSLANWQRKTADFEVLMEDLLGFVYHHGKPVFTMYRAKILDRIVHLGLRVTLPDFKYFERRFLKLHGRITCD